MRPVRSALIALGAACALVPTFAGVAEAQEPYIVNMAAECNTTTGEYDITTTFVNNTGDTDFEQVVGYWETLVDDSEFDLPDFTLPDEGEFDVVFSAPGDSIYADLSWTVPEFQDSDSESIELDGDCVATVQTTVPTTVAPTTTTTAAMGAVTVTPSYTG